MVESGQPTFYAARHDAPPPDPVRDRIPALTEREKETLRLLLAGHDAKSIARHLALSVHTVNERLREARRKLGVSSSREAARLLAEAERGGPNFLADKHFGVATDAVAMRKGDQPDRRRNTSHRLAWLGGGMLIMSLVIAIAMLSIAPHGSSAMDAAGAQRPAAAATAPAAAESAAIDAAREWVALVDGQRWDESWRTAATLFRSQVSAAQWASTIQPVRQPLGPLSSRAVQGVTKADVLPGAPSGEYRIIQFQTAFARKSGAVETVVLAREGSSWKVAGYFIR